MIWEALIAPLGRVPWSDWRGFWLGEVLADRYVVCYFFPLLVVLALWPVRYLRQGIVLTGLVFLGWVYGAPYALLWLLLLLGLYALSERFAKDLATGRVPVWVAVGGAWLIVGGGYFASFQLDRLALPVEWNGWLWRHAEWVFPLGLRGWWFEPDWGGLSPRGPDGAPHLLAVIFSRVHLIGTAYLAVRMLHYFSEIARAGIAPERRTLLNFLAYTCYAPNLMQGPIERFNEFNDQIDTCHTRRGWHNVPFALWRCGLALVKALVGVVYFWPLVREQIQAGTYYKHPEQIESLWLLFFGVYMHIFWLYLVFSGYCDISAAMGRLLGYHQVENFRMPWAARSLRDFWRRWHISLSFILRDYVYIALGGNRRHVTLNLCATFALIGVWHAPAVQYLIWGVLMGVMLRVNQWWADFARRLDARPQTRLARLRRAWLRLWPLPSLCAWGLTMFCFVESLLVFFGGSAGWRVPLEVVRRLMAE